MDELDLSQVPLSPFIQEQVEQLSLEEKEKIFQKIHQSLSKTMHSRKETDNVSYRDNWLKMRVNQNIYKYTNKEKIQKQIQEKKEKEREAFFALNGYYPEKKTSAFELKWRVSIQQKFPERDVCFNLRPDWLKNERTGRNLEADLFFKKEKIVVEMNGGQHYEYTPHFHRNGEKDFLYQQWKDQHKKEKCEACGATLFSIAPWDKTQETLERLGKLLEIKK